MRKNIAAVIEAFRCGRPHREATCRTDGTIVWSYELQIATRLPSGAVEVFRGKAPSRTTKMQIRAIEATFPVVDRDENRWPS